ncbi:hypothetical protein Bpfe_013904 [Biomphalaria pfeifferi]|uniref:LicD/FKTN/FKRP nucleotidyltransferase domain-containing protein n=1 Tax=Biomphalaria pfeifferi TaxID=112525 RepID=A0AAD8BLV5_BIOPF|nr:hypothetical protein Bpfe_013904 [Biomphalaria pfeifferi]
MSVLNRMITLISCGHKKIVAVLRPFAYYVPWKAVYIVFIFFILTLYLMFIVINDRFMHHIPWYERSAPCQTPKSTLDLMVNLTFTVSDVLTKYGVNYVMCYGTLWGALRYGTILPWDNNVDFCALTSEIHKIDLLTLRKHLEPEGVTVVRNYRRGTYTITKGPAEVVINVFYVTPFGEVLQDGFENRFLWFFQDSPLSFPQRLMALPFKTMPFHNRPLPVPHDDLEMLKYLYKDDWWIEKKPPDCK